MIVKNSGLKPGASVRIYPESNSSVYSGVFQLTLDELME